MNRSIKWGTRFATAMSLGLAVTAALAQHHGPGHGPMAGMGHGPGMNSHAPMAGPTAMLTTQDAGSAADMALVHELLRDNTKIRRTVVRLTDGVRTVTESDDPKVAQAIKAHVASMSQRLNDGREFNIFSKTLPVLFDKRDRIRSRVEVTEKGSVVTRTSTDADVVAALQGHAGEVTELVQDGMAAMHRGMMSRMATMGVGPGARAGQGLYRQ
jgi:hypothetical protein